MKKFFATFALLCTLVVAAPRAIAADEKFFPLGLWYEGGVGDARDNVLPADPASAAPIYQKNFADIAAHGINVIAVPNSPPAHHRIVLDTAQKHGLKVILELDLDGGELGHMIRGGIPLDEKVARETLEKKLGPIKDHPALWRVQLLDEPTDFEKFGKVAAITRAFDPESHPFCCLIGNIDGAAFLLHSKSDVIAFDVYPYGPQHRPGDPNPLKHFTPYAQRFVDWAEAAEPRADAWAVLQCHEITGGLRFPTEAEVRAMTYTSLAAGNRGIFWFLYQTERVGKEQIMSGLVDRDFKPRPLWNTLPALIEEIKPLTPTLSRLRPDRAAKFEVKNGVGYGLRDADAADGTLYLFVINPDTLKERIAHITAPLRNGVITPLPGEQPLDLRGIAGTIEWDITLPPGGGKLFKVQ
ncbi:MAG: hypothetical protein QOF78_153 [Phycisphaerales bacterium]|jgi:hypothetical protein|nr:hypothetical protein [Phycisphaerales bacterium]